MTRPIHLELLTDFFNKIGHSRHFKREQATSASHPTSDILLRRTANESSKTLASFKSSVSNVMSTRGRRRA
jgi:hypothetical protein